MGADDGLPTIFFASAADWERWLEDNHAASDGVWIKMAKKGSGIDSVRYPEVLECALCFGWIDGRRQALDEHAFPAAVHARVGPGASGRGSTATRCSD